MVSAIWPSQRLFVISLCLSFSLAPSLSMYIYILETPRALRARLVSLSDPWPNFWHVNFLGRARTEKSSILCGGESHKGLPGETFGHGLAFSVVTLRPVAKFGPRSEPFSYVFVVAMVRRGLHQ